MAQKWDFTWMVVSWRRTGIRQIPNILGGTMPIPEHRWIASIEGEEVPLDQALARFADEGWELVAPVAASFPGPPAPNRQDHMLYFKRPRD